MVLSVVGVAAAPALAQSDPELPGATYYGTVQIDGEPAPVGTHVAAYVDGVKQDALTIEEAGIYGGPGGGDGQLVVGAEAGDEVQFFVNGEPVDTDPSPVVWESADSEQVNLTGTDVGQPNVTVEIDPEASVTTVEPNGTAAVLATVENTGDGEALDRTISFGVEGDRQDATTVSLSPGESRDVQFNATFAETGEYEATVDTIDATASVTISVEEGTGGGPGLPPPPPDDGDTGEPDVTVTNATLSETEIAPGDSVSIVVTLQNDADDRAFATLPITVDGTEVATETVTVEGGAETEVTFTRSFDEPGEYAIAVDGVDAGTVTVAPDDDSDTGGGDDSGDDGSADDSDDGSGGGDGVPGFGPVAAALALLAAVGVARLRVA